MKSLKIAIAFIFILVVGLFAGASRSYALTYSLIPPSGSLTTGQEVDFTIGIDTEGQTLTSTTVGMTYQTSFMQYVKTTNGNTMDQVTAQETQPGTIIFNGTKASPGFKGAGDFAKVTFKVIATSDSSEVCALFLPTPGPQQPTSGPAPTSAPQPTSGPAPTSAPQAPVPTALPRSGSLATSSLWEVFIIGGLLLVGGFYLFSKNPGAS